MSTHGSWYNGCRVCVFVDTKTFSTRLLPSSCLLLVRWWYYCCFIALTFVGNTCLMTVCIDIWLGILSLTNRLYVLCSHSNFTPSCVLYWLCEQSSAHISFCLILLFFFLFCWGNWSIKKFKPFWYQVNFKWSVQFCYLRLYLGTETVPCRLLQWMAKWIETWKIWASF